MQRCFQLLLLVLVTAQISGCSPFVTNTPPPPPQPIQVAYSPATRPYIEKLHQCALEHPGIGLVIQETSNTELRSTEADVTLCFGEPPQGIPGYALALGMDEITIIAGTNVALQNVSAEQLRDLYAGPDSNYQVWTYAEGNELRSIFDHAVLGEGSISSFALLAPNPAAMIEAIATDPMAIGYLPGSWLTEEVQRISLEGDLKTAFAHPVLALTDAEPEGNLRSYLVCLQKAAP
jgi:hypothetical protein